MRINAHVLLLVIVLGQPAPRPASTATVFLPLVMQAPMSPARIVAYFQQTDPQLSPAYMVSDVPWDRITHLIYASAQITNSQLVLGEPDVDIGTPYPGNDPTLPYAGNFNQLHSARVAHPTVRLLLSVTCGPWPTCPFSAAASTPDQRARTAASIVAMLHQYSFFDGIDIDWEFPAAADAHPFTLLLAAISQALDDAGQVDGRSYLLTAAVANDRWDIANTEPGLFAPSLDFLNVMTYDLHGPWNQHTGHNSNLYANPADPESNQANADWVMHTYLSYGIPAAKLNLGVPLYSRGFSHVSGGDHGLFGTFQG